jgi:hypothetical protein
VGRGRGSRGRAGGRGGRAEGGGRLGGIEKEAAAPVGVGARWRGGVRLFQLK